MASQRRLVLTVFLWLALLALPCASAETLREYLMARSIDPAGIGSPNLDRAITSGDCLDEEGLFLTAYYLEHESGGLVGPIQVEMLDKKRRLWTHKEIEKSWDTCPGGGILSIRRTKTGFCWYGHINPSAGVTFILSPTLELLGCVLGSYRGDFADGTIVYANSLPHFAPTHPGELSLYNTIDKSDRIIYPMKPWQAVRLAHMEKVRAAVEKLDPQWVLTRQRVPHDPELFTSHVSREAATSDATDSLAFIAAFDNSETLDVEGQVRLMYFTEVRKALREYPPASGLTGENVGQLCDALWQGFSRAGAEQHDCLLGAFDRYPEIREMVTSMLDTDLPKGMLWMNHAPVLDRRWASPDTWRTIERAVDAPPKFTEVVYVYRNVRSETGIEYREMLHDEVKGRFGEISLQELLEPKMLNVLFGD